MYILIDDADEVKCKWGKCTKSLCCDKVCSSFDCPKYYKLIDDADTIVCKDDTCTKDQCCEKGETHPTSYRSSTGFGLRLLMFERFLRVSTPSWLSLTYASRGSRSEKLTPTDRGRLHTGPLLRAFMSWTGKRICPVLLRLTVTFKRNQRFTLTAPTVCMVARYITMSKRIDV